MKSSRSPKVDRRLILNGADVGYPDTNLVQRRLARVNPFLLGIVLVGGPTEHRVEISSAGFGNSTEVITTTGD